MRAFFSRYLPSAILAIAPLVTNDYSILDLVGFSADANGTTRLGFIDGPKAEVELTVRLIATLAGIALMLLFGWRDAPPARTLEKFRREYLNRTIKDWRRKTRLHRDIRVNVMFAKWTLSGLVLRIVWKESFRASDKDSSIAFWWWQGACGKAYRKKDAVFVQLEPSDVAPVGWRARWGCGNRFKLTPFQLRKTKALKAVLCVPIIEKHGEDGVESYRCVGVINLDATTDAGTKYLEGHVQKLTTALAEHGTLIAKLR